MGKEKKEDLNNIEFSAQKADDLVALSNEMINAALANCEIQGFAKVELAMPQAIQGDGIQKVEPPSIESFFEHAELAWNSLLVQPTEDELNNASAPEGIAELYGESNPPLPE